MGKYKFEVSLEQITPYVCYKEDDILRTTEFKPRFDKFLGRKYGKELEKFKNNKEQNSAFNYKITISTTESLKKREEIGTFKTSGSLYKARRTSNLTIKVSFFSLHSELIKIIKENLAEFLALTNFGKRKNKCYGSFYIAKNDSLYVDIDDIDELKKYKFFNTEEKNYYKLKSTDMNKIFNDNSELEKEKKNGKFIMKRPFIIFRYLNPKKDLKKENFSTKEEFIEFEKNLKKKMARNESLGTMKILKKYDKNDENKYLYRLYFIPNDELIKAYKEKRKIERRDLNIFSKKEIFDADKFWEYIKNYK